MLCAVGPGDPNQRLLKTRFPPGFVPKLANIGNNSARGCPSAVASGVWGGTGSSDSSHG